jgi:hypothetical protein
LAQLAAGDIGDIIELLEPVAAAVARLTRRWALVFSDAETTHRWRAALEDGGLRYIRTGRVGEAGSHAADNGRSPRRRFRALHHRSFDLRHVAHADAMERRRHGGGLDAFHGQGQRTAGGHPCPKPLPLMVEIVKLFTDEGDLILDPFGGTATTARAAKLNGRRCIVSEVREEYCEISAGNSSRRESGNCSGSCRRPSRNH